MGKGDGEGALNRCGVEPGTCRQSPSVVRWHFRLKWCHVRLTSEAATVLRSLRYGQQGVCAHKGMCHERLPSGGWPGNTGGVSKRVSVVQAVRQLVSAHMSLSRELTYALG